MRTTKKTIINNIIKYTEKYDSNKLWFNKEVLTEKYYKNYSLNNLKMIELEYIIKENIKGP